MKISRILVTGGAGYIGSHACLRLLEQGFEVIVIDNLSNSSSASLTRVEELTQKKILFFQDDLRNTSSIQHIIRDNDIQAVMHFAGLKAVGESVEQPLAYYENNVGGSVSLFQAMQSCDVKLLIFSSSATVYGIPEYFPIRENSSLSAVNPYGATKLFIERIIADMHHNDPQWSTVILRYFNPVGAHSSGRIGEDPRGIPNNLMPYITQVAMKRLEKLSIYGNDYDTHDGTGVRDYIHVMDLVEGHIAALNYLLSDNQENNVVVNLGTGKGYSVLDLVQTFSQVNHIEVPYEILPRREGDIACCYADPQKAYDLLNWKSCYDITQMCRDSYRWQYQNLNGYS